MKMEKRNLFGKAFIIAFFVSLIGALMKINHVENSSIFLVIGLISTLIYIIIGIYEVNNSSKIKSSEKVLWTIGFLVLNFFAGLFYLINRNKIV